MKRAAPTMKSWTRNCAWPLSASAPAAMKSPSRPGPKPELMRELRRIHNAWSLTALEEAANQFQHDLCDEFYHLDRIDPKARYDVSTISVPVFVYKEVPVMCFVAGSFDKPISGAQIEDIASRMKESADRVTRLAAGQETVS